MPAEETGAAGTLPRPGVVYVLVVRTRYAQVRVHVFTDPTAAVAAAYATAGAYARNTSAIMPDHDDDAYLVWIDYSAVGDHVYVVEAAVDEEYKP
jgi:hypothetical protein